MENGGHSDPLKEDPRVAFVRAATWHGGIHTAVLGDDAAVRRFIGPDPASITAPSHPYGGDPLNYLCLSKYLRLDETRSDAFRRTAGALLDAGADPNDEAAVYHFPESSENDAMKALVETGKVTADNLTMMLIRKHAWHDYDGAKWLLEHGAEPNQVRGRDWYPLHPALARDNSLEMTALLLDHGADVSGYADVEELLMARGRG